MTSTHPTDAADGSWHGFTQLGAYSSAHVLTPGIAVCESNTSASIAEPDERSSHQRSASENPSKVLLVGDDPDLLETRAMVLASVGYDVTTFSSGDALESCPFSRFDCLIICHSITEAKAVFLATLMRDVKPYAPIIRLSLLPCTVADSFTSVCGTMHNPVQFVADMHAALGDRRLHTRGARSLVDSKQHT